MNSEYWSELGFGWLVRGFVGCCCCSCDVCCWGEGVFIIFVEGLGELAYGICEAVVLSVLFFPIPIGFNHLPLIVCCRLKLRYSYFFVVYNGSNVFLVFMLTTAFILDHWAAIISASSTLKECIVVNHLNFWMWRLCGQGRVCAIIPKPTEVLSFLHIIFLSSIGDLTESCMHSLHHHWFPLLLFLVNQQTEELRKIHLSDHAYDYSNYQPFILII